MTRPFDGLPALLAAHDIDSASEEPFPNDGWSGATLTRWRDRSGRGYVLKRDSLAADWIAQATRDDRRRELVMATADEPLAWPARNPALGAAWTRPHDEFAVLMPDLTGILFDWDTPLTIDQLDAVLSALVALHEADPPEGGDAWTDWTDRVTLICRSSLERPGPARDAVADRLLPGWDAWDRTASAGARAIVAALSDDPVPLVTALGVQPGRLLHGDLKLANAGIAADGAMELVDWQMVMVAPVAIELGWFLVSNVNALPWPPAEVLARYWARRGLDPGRENDLAILVGLLLRGWRKGLDAEAGVTLASGVSAADDLAWWCERAVEAADRLL